MSETNSLMLVSVIIVNYNTFNITCDCIESTLRCTKNVAYEIIVVDNASPNDNPDEFLVRFPSITLIKSKENGGFAKGNNQGIAVAKGDIILLLNSDTVLTEDSVSIAALELRKHADVGALGVRLVYPNGRIQHTARKFRTIRNELLDFLRPILLLIPYRKRSQLMLNQYFKADYNTYCDWVMGAFMMFNKSLLDHMPGKKLDERFFMYGEDLLWCYQFLELGYKSYFLADTTVIHINNASTAPSKQLQMLKMFIGLEMATMEYRKGKGLYYLVFGFIVKVKEMARYYIKVAAMKMFKYKIK